MNNTEEMPFHLFKENRNPITYFEKQLQVIKKLKETKNLSEVFNLLSRLNEEERKDLFTFITYYEEKEDI